MRFISLLLIVLIVGCNAHIQGSASSLPTSLPCEKHPDPKPVKFSCKRAVQIINRLRECEQKDDDCLRKVQHYITVYSVECQYKLKKKDLEIKTEKEKNKIVFKEQQKKAITNIIVWSLISGVVGSGLGFVVGFFASRGISK